MRVSFEFPIHFGRHRVGTICILEAIRGSRLRSRFYQARAAKCLQGAGVPQTEKKRHLATKSLRCGEVFSYWATVITGKATALCEQRILFNHESPRRGENLSRENFARVAAIKYGLQKECFSGTSKRNAMGLRAGIVEGMWRICNTAKATILFWRRTKRIRPRIAEAAFAHVDLDGGTRQTRRTLRTSAEVDC